MEMWLISKIKCLSKCDPGSKILPPPTGCSAHLKSTQGYFSARSRLNEGVRSATAIMMWPCGWNGQKKATNFGQTSGQLQTRHTQTKTMLNMKYASLTFIQLYLH